MSVLNHPSSTVRCGLRAVRTAVRRTGSGYFFYGYWFSHWRA